MLRPGNLTVVRIDPDASLFHVVSNDDSLETEEQRTLLVSSLASSSQYLIMFL